MAKEDYYRVLGLSRTASQDDIKKEYRKLAMRYHPDKNPDHAEEAAETFKLISEAYTTLSHPEKRLQYDTYGHHDSNEQQQQGAPYNASNPRRTRRHSRNVYTVDLGLADPYSGIFEVLDSVFSTGMPTREASHHWGSPLFSSGDSFNTFHSLFAELDSFFSPPSLFRTNSEDFAHTSTRGSRRASQSTTGSFTSTTQRGPPAPSLRSHTRRTVITRNADGRRVTRTETIICDEHENQQTFVEETVGDSDFADNEEEELQARLAQHHQRHHHRQQRMPSDTRRQPSYAADIHHQPTRRSSRANAHGTMFHTVPGHIPINWTPHRRQRVEPRYNPPVEDEMYSSFLSDPFFTSFFR